MNQNSNLVLNIIFQGAILIALAVIVGAFGAHSLKSHLTDHQLAIFETGNRYHFYHGFGILILAGLNNFILPKKLKMVTMLLVLGVLLFSGSLYLLATRELLGISSWKFLGPLTPIGGVFFISGWAYLAWAAILAKRNRV